MSEAEFDALCELINDIAYLEATRQSIARSTPAHIMRLQARVRRSQNRLRDMLVKENDNGDPSKT